MQQKGEGIFPRLFVRHDGAPNSRSSCCAAQIFPRGGEIFSLPVARWGATFCSFRGIGEGGTAFPRESWSRGGGPCGPRYAGAPREHGKAMLGTRVPFVSRRKEPKACQGRCPWTPLGGRLKSVPLFSPIPPATLCVAPPRKGRVPLRVEGFATLTQ